ncbi:unnamed protein product [Closterium sp. NIES-64]|nr:unnamed protein product [Closterium sp. NIES-64]
MCSFASSEFSCQIPLAHIFLHIFPVLIRSGAPLPTACCSYQAHLPPHPPGTSLLPSGLPATFNHQNRFFFGCRCPPPAAVLLPPPCIRTSLHRRTPCIGLAPSAMVRMTAVAMGLPGLLVGLALGAAIAAISMMPLGRVDTNSQQFKHPPMLLSASPPHANATATGGHLSLQHDHAPNPPLQTSKTLVPLLMMLYVATATLMALMWGMGVTHTQVRAWVHQQGLAVTAGLMYLVYRVLPPMCCHPCAATHVLPPMCCHPCAATHVLPPMCCHPCAATHVLPPMCCHPCAATHVLPPMCCHPCAATHVLPPMCCHPCAAVHVLPLMKCAFAGMQRAGVVVGTVIASMAGTHKLEEMLMMRMRVMIGQVEERGGEMAAELAAVRKELAEQRDRAERRREADLRELREEMRVREDEMRAELARESEEMRREVQEVIWPRVLEGLAECGKGVTVDLGIIQSEGHERTAWEVSAGLSDFFDRACICLCMHVTGHACDGACM